MGSRGVRQGQTRAHGESTAEEVTKEEADKLEEPVQPELPEERAKVFRTPGFSRMRTTWSSEDWHVVARAQQAVEGRIIHNFADAFEVMNTVYDLVRTAETDENGEVVRDRFGFTVWKRTPSGSYDEDFTRLTGKQKEDLLFRITTRLFDWEQRAADAWGEAMFAKAQWEERFAIAFDAPMTGTVDDRKAAGNIDAREERYFAIFMSLYSRKAEAIVRSLSLLGQRIKDSMAG